jgi:hypothetical protein
MLRFQCPECDFGDHEVGHLTAEMECVICLEADGRSAGRKTLSSFPPRSRRCLSLFLLRRACRREPIRGNCDGAAEPRTLETPRPAG